MTQQPSAQARLTLQGAFERFAATVTPDDSREFANTELNDVRDEAIKIERQLRARRTQRNMARLEPFLRGMEHYSKVVEVLCNGTPYLSWIWAPVKLMLMITVDSLSAFEKLIEAYGKIADMLPRFDRLATALSDDHNFQAVLALIYTDIVEIHRRAYKFVRRKSWAIFFGSMWAGFESRFDTILRRLAYHSELLHKEAVAADISNAVTHWKEEADRWEQQEREWQAVKNRAVLSWLATDDIPPEDTLERHTRDCLPSSCDWFIQHRKTQLWLKDDTQNTLLWLYGKPGAGKSVICSSLVQHAEANGTNVFYYFCSYLGSPTDSCSRLLRSLAAQITQKHQDLAVYIHDVYFQSHATPSRKVLLDLLPLLLQGLGSTRFIIDGIDEWDAREQKELLKDLTQIMLSSSSCICKILIASRDTLEISRSLRKKNKATMSISLSDNDEGSAIGRSIEHFVDKKLSDLPDHFDELDPNTLALAQIKRTLLDKSDGMFLWVRLVLDSLETVYSLEELRNLVEDLPTELGALYGRILDRICSVRGPHIYGGVPRMLSWICFSQRPLHKHELLHGLAILPTDTGAETQSVPVAQILDHCKPFIEERLDSTVTFVHFSVKEFLLKCNAHQVVQPIQAQLDISLACIITLIRGLDFLIPDASPIDNLVRVASGTYRLLPYALEYWIEHCVLYATKEDSVDLNQLLLCRLTQLRGKHDQLWQTSDTGEPAHHDVCEVAESQLDDRLKLMAHLPIHVLMVGVLHVRWLTSQHFCKDGEDAETFAAKNDQTLFSKLAAVFESAVVHLLTQDGVAGVTKAALEAFQRSYASTAFRCRFPNCAKSLAGFASPELRSEHEATHYRLVYCRVAGCQYNLGFKNKAGLDAHTRRYHNKQSFFSIPPKIRCMSEDTGEIEDSQTRSDQSQAVLQDSSSDPGIILDLVTAPHAPPNSIDAITPLEQRTSVSVPQGAQILKAEDVLKLQCLSGGAKSEYERVMRNLWRTVQSRPASSIEYTQANLQLQEWSSKLITQERTFRARLIERQLAKHGQESQPTKASPQASRHKHEVISLEQYY